MLCTGPAFERSATEQSKKKSGPRPLLLTPRKMNLSIRNRLLTGDRLQTVIDYIQARNRMTTRREQVRDAIVGTASAASVVSFGDPLR
jgi:hypothetical protein